MEQPGTFESAKFPTSGQLLICCWGESMFGVPIMRIREIVKRKSMSRIPRSPTWMIGAINHRGRIYTIWDLADILGIQQREGSDGFMLLLDDPEWLIGLAVHQVVQIKTCDEEMIMKGEATEQRGMRYVQRICQLEGRLVNVLDVGRMIQDHVNV